MKPSILSSSLLLLASFYLIDQVNSNCFDLAKQYYECKNLKMIQVNQGAFSQYYIPDPKVKGNVLDNSFYKSLGLNTIGFNAAMDVMRQIDNVTSGKSNLSDCVNKPAQKTWNGDYRFYFSTDQNFADMKAIISSLDTALAKDRYSNKELEKSWDFGGDKNLTALSDLCIQAEYSSTRLREYKNYNQCYRYNSSLSSACDYFFGVDSKNRKVLLERNNDKLVGELICGLIGYTDCSTGVQQFTAMSRLVENYPEIDLTNLGASLLTVVQSLGDYARILKNKLPAYDYAEISLSSNTVYYKAFNTGNELTDLKNIGTNLNCLSSKQLKIKCEISTDSNKQPVIGKVSISAYDGTSTTDYTIDLNKQDSLQNQTITNSNGLNIFQVVQNEYGFHGNLDIYDFNSQSIISYSKNSLYINGPSSLFQSSKGFLIDGAKKK